MTSFWHNPDAFSALKQIVYPRHSASANLGVGADSGFGFWDALSGDDDSTPMLFRLVEFLGEGIV